MARNDWFRNTDWSASIEEAFFAKLAKARPASRAQYLRVQACLLAPKHPVAALQLLDQFFASGDGFDTAQAHVDRATAFLALGRTADALDAYEQALAVEAVKPNAKTNAYLNYPFLVAVRGLGEHFDRAAQLLADHQIRLTFPVDRFRWHAAHAFIASAREDSNEAKAHATRALAEATRQNSGFANHPEVGLVGSAYADIRDRLAVMSAHSDA